MPFPSPGDLPDPGIEPTSPSLAGEFFTAELPGRPQLTAILLYTLLEVRHTWGNTWAETDLSQFIQQITIELAVQVKSLPS